VRSLGQGTACVQAVAPYGRPLNRKSQIANQSPCPTPSTIPYFYRPTRTANGPISAPCCSWALTARPLTGPWRLWEARGATFSSGRTFRVIYDAIIAVAARCGAFDAVLVRAELIDRGQWEQVGDLPALVRLLHAVPSAAHAEHYARRLVELWRRRRAWRIGAGLARRMLPDQTAEQTKEVLQRAIAALGEVATEPRM
jgi:hypothetical protein